MAEHNVLSLVPYLQSAPTQTITGTEVQKPKADGSVETEASDTLVKTTSQTKTTTNDPYGPRRWHSNLVKLSGKNRALNEFSVERVGEQIDNNLVVIHGYGAGLGFFYKNFEALSRPKGWRLYALDLLGMGRSSRPPFKIRAKERKDSIREAEDWFVDSLEEWRKQRDIERFTLLGHSLGGYLAVAYALKYPGHLNKLILASPVGIPEDPYAVNADMPEPQETNIQAEFEQTQDDSSGSSNAARLRGDNNNFMNARSKAGDASNGTSDQPPRRPLSKWITYLWDANFSPFSFVRWTGPLGPRFVSGWTTRRFSHLPQAEAQALHTYAYTLFKQRGSGEYALAYILAPGAFARSPLIRRISGVGRQYIQPDGSAASTVAPARSSTTSSKAVSKASSTAASTSNIISPAAGAKREAGVPVVLMYGENDWMDVSGGYDAADKIDAATQEALANATPEEREADNGSAKVYIIKNAGHHLYLEGDQQFNELMLQEMEDVKVREAKRKQRLAAA